MQHTSRRSAVYSTHASVTSSQPLATSAGIHVLRALGGNAVDAAIAVAAVLAVTEPCSTGLGGDAFALYYDADTRRVRAINGSGRSSRNISRELVAKTHAKMPSRHGYAVTVPGSCAAWFDMHEHWGSGRLSMGELLAPAIELAGEGFAVGPVTSHWWTQRGAEQLQPGSPLLPAPKPGELFRNPSLCATLADLAAHGRKSL
jgi:gamma-glutamyltranspeptidase/glutathione hydrolase